MYIIFILHNKIIIKIKIINNDIKIIRREFKENKLEEDVAIEFNINLVDLFTKLLYRPNSEDLQQ